MFFYWNREICARFWSRFLLLEGFPFLLLHSLFACIAWNTYHWNSNQEFESVNNPMNDADKAMKGWRWRDCWLRRNHLISKATRVLNLECQQLETLASSHGSYSEATVKKALNMSRTVLKLGRKSYLYRRVVIRWTQAQIKSRKYEERRRLIVRSGSYRFVSSFREKNNPRCEQTMASSLTSLLYAWLTRVSYCAPSCVVFAL